MKRTTSNPMQREVALVLLSVAALQGCGGYKSLAPPEILYGQQECDHCRMIISDERFAAAMIVEYGDGSRTTLIFDDVNCLIEDERECEGCNIRVRFVHDINTRQWLDAAGAAFVVSDSLETPMASGTAAAASRDALLDLQREHDGEFLDFAALRDRFIVADAAGKDAKP